MSALEYFFGPRKDGSGKVFEFSRFDVALSILLGLSLLAAVSYSAEPHNGWTRLRVSVVLGVVVVTTLIAHHRQIVFGCAFGIVTMKLALGALSRAHPLFFLIGAIVCATATWFLLNDAG